MKNPYRQYNLGTISNIMMCCIIMYNMILKDKQGQDLESIFYEAILGGGMCKDLTFRELNVGIWELENVHTHFSLHNVIMDHLRHLWGESRI